MLSPKTTEQCAPAEHPLRCQGVGGRSAACNGAEIYSATGNPRFYPSGLLKRETGIRLLPRC